MPGVSNTRKTGPQVRWEQWNSSSGSRRYWPSTYRNFQSWLRAPIESNMDTYLKLQVISFCITSSSIYLSCFSLSPLSLGPFSHLEWSTYTYYTLYFTILIFLPHPLLLSISQFPPYLGCASVICSVLPPAEENPRGQNVLLFIWHHLCYDQSWLSLIVLWFCWLVLCILFICHLTYRSEVNRSLETIAHALCVNSMQVDAFLWDLDASVFISFKLEAGVIKFWDGITW